MRHSMRQFRKITEGEHARTLAFFLMGICSAVFGFLAVLHLDSSVIFNGMNWFQTWIVISSGLGGAIALFLSGDRMGQAGLNGAARGFAGAIWVTFIGALAAGTLALPFYGTMFGPFIVCVTMLGAPFLALLWTLNLLAVHILLGRYQRERDTIFAPEEMVFPGYPDPRTVRLRGRVM